MKTIIVLMCMILIIPLIHAQVSDSIAVPRAEKFYKISTRDSMLIKDMVLGFSRGDTTYHNKLQAILDDCTVIKKTKTTLVDLLFKEGDTIDPKLFWVLSETLFFIGYEDFYINDNPDWVTDFYILDIIYKKKNAFEFCEYVIENNVLNRCTLFYPKCHSNSLHSDFYFKNEMFLKKFAAMYQNADLKKLETIIMNTNNECILYNLSSLIYFIKNK